MYESHCAIKEKIKDMAETKKGLALLLSCSCNAVKITWLSLLNMMIIYVK